MMALKSLYISHFNDKIMNTVTDTFNLNNKPEILADAREKLILHEQILTVGRTALGSSITNVVAALFLIAALWEKVPTISVGVCLLFICAVTLNRTISCKNLHFIKAETKEEVERIGLRVTIAVGLNGLAWGVAGFILFTPEYIPGQSLLTMLLIGLACGSITTSTPYLPANYFYVIGMLVPLIVRTGMQGDALHIFTTGLLIIYLSFVLFFSRKMNRLLTDSLRMRYENIDLIDELKEQKETAESARREAEAANRAKSQFLAAASHDLRQPLHALGLFAATLSERIHYPEVRNIVDNINASVESLEELFNELLDISKLDAGIILPSISSFPIQQLFDRIWNDYAPQADARGLELKVHKSSAIVYSDYTLLERIVRNLVVNAIRYTEKGKVLVGVRHRQGKLSIEVWDTGIGISPEQSEKVFEEFYQVGNQERDRTKGLGLGLAIVRRLTKLLDHPLELKSAVGRGSAFRIEVPVGKLAQLSEAALGNTTPDKDYLKGKKIVLIDDERSVREGMQTLLREWGCHVVGYGEIKELDNLPFQPDLIIADYRLRDDETGAQAIRKVQNKYGDSIPGILITGDTAPDRIREARASGYQLMHKPVPPTRLKIVISYMLSQ